MRIIWLIVSFLWRYLLGPILSPVLMAPMMLLGSVAMPLQLILILATWGLLFLHVAAAAAFVAVASLYYTYNVFVAPSPRNPRVYLQWASKYSSSPGNRISMVVFTVGMLVTFLLGLVLLPSFHPVARWFAALGLAYYASSVASGYIVALTTPSLEEQMKRIARRDLETGETVAIQPGPKVVDPEEEAPIPGQDKQPTQSVGETQPSIQEQWQAFLRAKKGRE